MIIACVRSRQALGLTTFLLLLIACRVAHASGDVFHSVVSQIGQASLGLSQELARRERDHAALAQSLRLCATIDRQIIALSSQIEKQLRYRKQAELLPGASFNPTQLNLLSAQREELHVTLRRAQAEHRERERVFASKYAGIAERFSALLASYQGACGLVRTLTHKELEKARDILATHAFREEGYAEAVLLTLVTIRLGGDVTPAVHALKSHASAIRASNALGYSPIGIDRLTLSILCDSDEDVADLIKLFKTNRAVRDEPGTIYMLACYYASKADFKSALRYAISAHRKLKSGDAHNRLCAAADAFVYACAVDHDSVAEEKESFLTELAKTLPQIHETPDCGAGWQVKRAQIVLAVQAGDDIPIQELIERQGTFIPPTARRVLDHVADSEAVGQ